MRVHVNGRLSLIKESVIEYPNGDEVISTLVYERLERHCSQCGKLDHELRDGLEAKAQKKDLKAQKSKDAPVAEPASRAQERAHPSD